MFSISQFKKLRKLQILWSPKLLSWTGSSFCWPWHLWLCEAPRAPADHINKSITTDNHGASVLRFLSSLLQTRKHTCWQLLMHTGVLGVLSSICHPSCHQRAFCGFFKKNSNCYCAVAQWHCDYCHALLIPLNPQHLFTSRHQFLKIFIVNMFMLFKKKKIKQPGNSENCSIRSGQQIRGPQQGAQRHYFWHLPNHFWKWMWPARASAQQLFWLAIEDLRGSKCFCKCCWR